MFKKFKKFTLAAAIVTVAIVPELGSANALPVLPLNNSIKTQASDVLQVQYMHHRRMGPSISWQFGRDGNRCRSRYGNCRHYYQGYYYETPWWALPLIIGDQITRQHGGNSHVSWCLSRYRSYNPRTDMWLGNNGRRYQCNSPY